jgi:peptidyl-prolyl cis-trans isomerase D
MGVFNKINQKSGLIGTIIAIAVLIFILNDLLGPRSFFFTSNDVGEIAGHDVSYQEYNKLVDQFKQNMGGSLNDYQAQQAQNQAWAYLVTKYAYPKQYEKLGITVSEEELEELVSGKNLWEGFYNVPIFQDPNTRQFDRKLYDKWKKNMEADTKGQEALEKIKKENILEDRLRSKYFALFTNGIYVTKEEAQRDYKAQNTKAEVKYLYVPYYSIPDSAIKDLKDSELADYIRRHEQEYKKPLRAGIEYVVFNVKPSIEDSLQVTNELADIKKDLEKTTDDSSFVVTHSDNGMPPSIAKLGELPDSLKLQVNHLQKGQVYGPYSEFGKLKLYKVLDVIEDPKDSVYYASTKHILFMTRGKSPEEKDSIKKKANDVLNQLKQGASFDEMVMKYSEDPGSKSKGGEYKWFPKGQMVKPFENAVFNAKGPGLVPTLVETEYGFHILKVTDTKSNKKFKLATIEKEIVPSEGRDKAYNVASNFASTVKDSSSFRAAAKKDSLPIQKFDNLTAESPYVNNLSNPRELIQWSLVKGGEGDISPVFQIGEQYVVAILLKQRKEGVAEVDEVKDEVKQKVLAQKKAELIIEKLSKTQGTMEKKAEAYGPSATVGVANDVTLASGSMQGVGQEPAIVGTVFGLVPGKRTVPLKGDYGVAVLELIKITEAPAVADYSTYKNNLISNRKSSITTDIESAIKEDADIEDNRVKFF